MSTADLKNKLIEIASNLDKSEDLGYDIDYGFAKAIITSPKQLKRLSKRKLSDGCELRVFGHQDVEDEYLAVVEHPNGKLELSMHHDLDLVPVMFRARLPGEYAFCVIKHRDSYTIPIAPAWALEDSADSDEAYSARELESVWNTNWFQQLFDTHLETSMEGIFAPSSANVDTLDIIAFMEGAGLTYSEKMELEELEACDLPKEAGGSYFRGQASASFDM